MHPRPALLALAVVLPATMAVAAPTLDRTLQDYFVFAQRSVSLKNLAIEPPGCHIGVNCAQDHKGEPCGVMYGKNVRLEGSSQAVADRLCVDDVLGAVFRNNTGQCDPTCAMIADPGPGSDCTTTFATPILPDLDHDGHASCANDCDPDVDDVAIACGIVQPMPACNPGRPVLVRPDGDCSTADRVPGNGRCDLPAGVFGDVKVRNGARIEFDAGVTVLCSLKAGKATRIASVGPATIVIPGSGFAKVNNAGDVGSTCGQLKIVTDGGPVRFGRNGDFALDVCSLRGQLNLGHGNNLMGHFVGARVAMDFDNDGRCCDASIVTTTTVAPTTTTSSASSTTSTSTPGTTSTSAPGTTSTSTAGTTSTSTAGTTSTSAPGTTSTSGPGTTSTSTTSTATAPSTTSTTVPSGGTFTRTIGFYKTHPAITRSILAAHGPLLVCGVSISNVDVGSPHSALEAMCITPHGDQRLQLVRQLTAAALTMAAGGASYADFAGCNAVCANPASSASALTACIGSADGFNQSGDAIAAPWDPPGAASTSACDLAARTACQVLAPSACTAP